MQKHAPNLWVSADMEVTPGTRKSKGGTGYSRSAAKGSTKPPKHASEWHSTPASFAACTQATSRTKAQGSHYGRRIFVMMALHVNMAATTHARCRANAHMSILTRILLSELHVQ